GLTEEDSEKLIEQLMAPVAASGAELAEPVGGEADAFALVSGITPAQIGQRLAPAMQRMLDFKVAETAGGALAKRLGTFTDIAFAALLPNEQQATAEQVSSTLVAQNLAPNAASSNPFLRIKAAVAADPAAVPPIAAEPAIYSLNPKYLAAVSPPA